MDIGRAVCLCYGYNCFYCKLKSANSGIDHRTTWKTVGRRKYALVTNCKLQILRHDNVLEEESCFLCFMFLVVRSLPV